MKIIVLVYLLSPYTHGSSILYRKFVHPTLVQRCVLVHMMRMNLINKVGLASSFCKSRIIFFLLREERIDALLETAQTQSYNTAMELGQRGIRLGHFVDI